jgi:hypothetical protein
LLDEAIDPEEILKGTLEAKALSVRPGKMPIAAEWPEEVFTTPEGMWIVEIGSNEYSLDELDLRLVAPSLAGPLVLAIASGSDRAELELELFDANGNPDYRFLLRDTRPVEIRRGKRGNGQSVVAFFDEHPPVIWFADGSSLEGNQYVALKATQSPYDAQRIQAWDWSGVDLRKESQGELKSADSIQARVIRELLRGKYDVIFDDDGSGEAADVVAIRVIGDFASPSAIEVEFYHCKYSQDAAPGQRIGDLYEVCGQAQKSIAWMSSPEKRRDLFAHLLRREAKRQARSRPSRFESGEVALVQTIREMVRLCPMTLKIFIVQPGVSRSVVTPEQLRLMSVTENHLMETFQLPFGVIASR